VEERREREKKASLTAAAGRGAQVEVFKRKISEWGGGGFVPRKHTIVRGLGQDKKHYGKGGEEITLWGVKTRELIGEGKLHIIKVGQLTWSNRGKKKKMKGFLITMDSPLNLYYLVGVQKTLEGGNVFE